MSRWSKKVLIDKYFRDAKDLKYVSRAAFKLIEIQKKHRLISKGAHLLDLGCAPGAWLQVGCQELGPKKRGGLVLGVDIQDVTLPEAHIDDRVRFLKHDARHLSRQQLREYSPEGFDVVLSDMLHFTSGNAVQDVGTSLELAGIALQLAVGRFYSDLYGSSNVLNDAGTDIQDGVLKEGGHMAMKIFEGAGTIEFVKQSQKYFQKVTRMRPAAVRKSSREFYLICKDRKPIGVSNHDR